MSNLRDQLIGKSRKKAAGIKSSAIAKLIVPGNYSDSLYGLDIEIQKIALVDGALELFARAWKGNKQLGFGSDGSVDIERFRFFNPPILIDDPSGNIVENMMIDDELRVRKMNEDPVAALNKYLSETIKTVGKTDIEIQKGKVGNTTSTIFASYGGEFFPAGAADFAASRALTTAAIVDNDAQRLLAGIRNDGTNAVRIVRSGVTFGVSIGTDIISSAVISLHSIFKNDNDNDAQAYITIDKWNPASLTTYVGADWDNFLGDKQTDDIDITGVSDEAYYDFTFIDFDEINKTGNCSFMIREGHDYENIAAVLGTGQYSRVLHYSPTESGTTKDPKMVLVHTPASSLLGIERTPTRGVGRGIMRP